MVEAILLSKPTYELSQITSFTVVCNQNMLNKWCQIISKVLAMFLRAGPLRLVGFIRQLLQVFTVLPFQDPHFIILSPNLSHSTRLPISLSICLRRLIIWIELILNFDSIPIFVLVLTWDWHPLLTIIRHHPQYIFMAVLNLHLTAFLPTTLYQLPLHA